MDRMKTSKNKCFSERVRVETRIAQQFDEKWGWLVEEYAKGRKELNQAFVSQSPEDQPNRPDLKPFPVTASGVVGWLSTRPDCKLEVYGPDVCKPPPLPDIYVVTRLNDPLSDGLEYCD